MVSKKFITKNTFRDKWEIVSKAIETAFDIEGHSSYSYLLDMDDQYVYFDIYDYTNDQFKVYRAEYTFTGTSATVNTEEVTEVVKTTTYKEVDKPVTESMVKRLIDSMLPKSKGVPVLKQFEEEEMIAIEAIYISKKRIDLVGDAYASPNEVYDMVDHINKSIEDASLQSKLFHKKEVNPKESFEYLKAWVSECDCMIGDTFVEEGTPLIKVQFHNEDMWEDRKNGELMGLSIGFRVDEIIEVEDEQA
jgi:hypothetical protein